MSITLKQTEGKMTKMINSFVFLDLETTDLIRYGIMPRITELAMVAVLREHIKIPQSKLPRVLAKLVIPINPNENIPKIVTKITELTNHHLKNIKQFDFNVCGQINHFLQRLEEPICFVAHNGKKFDYPILLNEFQNYGEVLPSEILAVDSLDVFRHYFKEKSIIQEQKKMKETLETNDNCHSLLKDNWDDVIGSVLDSTDTLGNCEEISKIKKTDSFDSNKDLRLNLQRNNDKTPDLKITREETMDYAETHKIIQKEQIFTKPANLKLETIFKNMTGSYIENSHYAESDCLSLIRCANLIGEDFIEFADNNAKLLNTYERHIQ
ncbi:uncharacterized protein LOC122506569 [Leptopilina heterotoma]|uniref:uncharacterized protein LOC122506569 n=1 Tax=Leptopilina heterotoma TaxID=63436 RepID=UPI001CA9EAF0|nr:uncharacterized protein LOC122506569 [Leptopilina heterotoma]